MNDNDLLNYALKILGIKSYSERKLRQKLRQRFKQKGLNCDEIKVEEILAKLKDYNYIDDYKYALNIVRNYLEYKPCGIYYLKQLLKKHLLDDSTIKRALESYIIDEMELAKKLIKKKENLIRRYEGIKKKQKIISILTQKGFSPPTIINIVNLDYQEYVNH